MKKVTIILLGALIFSACNFSKSVNKDLITGAIAKGDGLSCNDMRVQINGKIEKRNIFTFGESVIFVFNDISGFIEENGKVYPEISMLVIKENQTVLSNLNLLNPKEGTDLSPLQLQVNLSATFPYQNNEEYEMKITIWDTKGEGKFTYNMPFSIKENENLKIKANKLTYQSIFLWNENHNKMVFDKKINAEEKYSLVLDGIDGLKVDDGKVFPEVSLMLTDAKGNIIIANKNLYSNQPNGFDATTFAKSQIPIILTFRDGDIFNPYHLNVLLKDTKSEKQLLIETELELEKK